ncbi:hypothetical protein PUN28_003741 [Cardiocondyla obscurior]|uniref:Uncharacterized protein n=1 Tax=Cardiocondyla obscurior TaxID=286306 RepID=A0AAW2GK42_9HYME
MTFIRGIYPISISGLEMRTKNRDSVCGGTVIVSGVENEILSPDISKSALLLYREYILDNHLYRLILKCSRNRFLIYQRSNFLLLYSDPIHSQFSNTWPSFLQ